MNPKNMRVQFTSFLLMLAVSALLVVNLGCARHPVDLWIISGQSNACGRGPLPGPQGIPEVRMSDPSKGRFVVATDPLPGMNTRGVGPWVAAAQRVARTGRRIDLVGYARGGRPISYWNPGNQGDKELMPRIARAGKGAGVFLWYQGESDTHNAEDAAAYQQRLTALVERVRKAADSPGMTAVIIQIGAMVRKGPAKGRGRWMTVREAQRQFVLADGNALLVPAIGRSLKDGVHLSTPGYQELGEEIGRALLRSRYKHADVDWPGPVLDVAVLAEGGRRVTAHFAEVRQLSGVTESDFVVTDPGGATVCREAKHGATTVELAFDRRITLPARLVYAYGDAPTATLVDEAGNRAPAVHINLTAGSPPADEPTAAPNGAGVN
jgi:hypothetical protein